MNVNAPQLSSRRNHELWSTQRCGAAPERDENKPRSSPRRIDIFKYVIYGLAAAFFVYGILLMVEGFFTTGAIRDLYGDFKITACGRCVSAWVCCSCTFSGPCEFVSGAHRCLSWHLPGMEVFLNTVPFPPVIAILTLSIISQIKILGKSRFKFSNHMQQDGQLILDVFAKGLWGLNATFTNSNNRKSHLQFTDNTCVSSP